MIRIACVGLIAALLVFVLITVVNLYDDLLPVGRMWETPVIRPHEEPIPVMAAGSVPWNNAEALYRNADPDTLQPPFDLSDDASVARGGQGYRYYCIHCHGPNYDGYGTVGQSFAPPPYHLRSERIQNLPAGRIFHEISYGIPNGRQPPLAATIAVDERWQIVGYIKSLGKLEE